MDNDQSKTQTGTNDTMRTLVIEALQLASGWREIMAMLEDHGPTPVEAKNMIAGLNQLDDWCKKAREAIKK